MIKRRFRAEHREDRANIDDRSLTPGSIGDIALLGDDFSHIGLRFFLTFPRVSIGLK